MQGGISKRIVIQAGLGIKQHPMSKITKVKRAESVAQVVEHPPSKCKALSPTLTQYRQKKKKKKVDTAMFPEDFIYKNSLSGWILSAGHCLLPLNCKPIVQTT
jgi:hypothetical protein